MNSQDGVGYRRPPQKNRFRRGHSGNPGGRPKRRPSFRTALLEELAANVAGRGQGAGSKLQALVKTLVDTAIAGDGRAQSVLVGVLARIGDAEEVVAMPQKSEDQAILDAYVGDELKRRANDNEAAPSTGNDNGA